MRSTFVFVGIALALFITGCSKTAVPIEFSKACSQENEKKYLEISGFLDDKGGVFCSNIGGRMDCGFTFLEKPGDAKGIKADIEQGSGANTVDKLERGYKKEDIKIRDNSGNVINMAEKVKITGEMNVTPDGSLCFVEVDKITK
jgi:hypothetical protein